MWKKLNNARATRQPTIPESPSAYDSVYDGSEDWAGRAGKRTISPPIKDRSLPARPLQDGVSRDLPRLP